MGTGSGRGETFGRSRNGMSRRQPGEPGGSDAVLVDAFHLVRRHDDAPGPSAAFLARLEADLLDRAGRARPAGSRLRVGGGAGRDRTPSWLGKWLVAPPSGSPALLATAALIVLTLVATFVAFRPGREGVDEETRSLAVGQAGTPRAGGCDIVPRREVPAPPRSGSAENVLPSSLNGRPGMLDAAGAAALWPEARPPDPAAVDGVAATLRALAACETAAGGVDPALRAAFYTDHYLFFALDMPAMTPPRTIAGEQLRRRLDALRWVSVGPGGPTIEDARLLARGEVGAVVRPRQGSPYVVVFARTDDGWLIDELAEFPVPASATPAAGTPPTGPSLSDLAAVTMFDGGYVPRELTIPAGTPVTLALSNAGQAPHAFVVEALGIDVPLRPGETATITAEAPASAYEFISDIPGQRAAGLLGTLTVVDRDRPASATSATTEGGAFAPSHRIAVDVSVNLRPKPSMDEAPLAALPPETPLRWLGEEARTVDPAVDGQRWLRIRTEDGLVGWVREIDVEPYRE